MSLVADAADLGLWEWDIERDQMWMTERTRAIFGINGSKKVNLNQFLQLLHEDDRELANGAMHRALQDGSDYEMEYRVKQPNGTLRWLAARHDSDQRQQETKFDARGFDRYYAAETGRGTLSTCG